MYLTGADPDGAKRTWQDVLTVIIELKHGPTRDRWGVASLLAEDVDWNIQTIAYRRRKTGTPVVLRFGDEFTDLQRNHLPVQGPLFPQLAELHEKHRAKLFNR